MKKYLPICIIVLLSIVSLSIYGKDNKKEEFKTNTIKENDNRFTIAAYINGVYSDTMPAESKYFGYVECKDSNGNKLDALGFVEWENDKWNVRITDITKASTCNVYFIDPPAHWLDAEEGTLLKAIKDNNKVENVKTIPGKQINKEDEAILSGTLDDYGTSYYFRGNVQNNYVQFAGKCWRIVRITGDGSIKLVLQNNNSIDCSSVKSIEKIAFNSEKYEKSDGTTGNLYQTASGVGFMYGDATAPNYLDAQANLHDSTILAYLKNWYDETFNITLENKLSDVIWCGDKSIYSGNGYGNTSTNFGAYGRLIIKNVPSLICPNIGEDGKLSKYTAADIINGNGMLKSVNGNEEIQYYKIGLLTADEMVFAGGTSNLANSNYYLYQNRPCWTMTPEAIESVYYGVIFQIGWNGTIKHTDILTTPVNLFPSVSLNYNVQATYDKTSEYEPGTVNNPYEIVVP